MDEDQLAQLHDDLVNGKSKRGKFGGIGSGERYSKLLDGPKRQLSQNELAKLPDRPLYTRFVLGSKKELSRHVVTSVLKANGGTMRWNELVMLVAEDLEEPVTREFKYRVLTNIPEAYLRKDSPLVIVPNVSN
jgi:hypothetical protein